MPNWIAGVKADAAARIGCVPVNEDENAIWTVTVSSLPAPVAELPSEYTVQTPLEALAPGVFSGIDEPPTRNVLAGGVTMISHPPDCSKYRKTLVILA